MTMISPYVPSRPDSPTAFELWADRLAMLFLCLYTAECAIGCSGRWLNFGPISIRMLLFGCCMVLTLPKVIRQIKDLIRLPYLWILLAFALVLGVSAVIGLRNGNSKSFLFADITSLLSFALFPGVVVTVNTRERLKLLMKVMFYATSALALVTTVLHFVLAFLSTADITALNNWFNDLALGGLAKMPTGVQRIYLRSQIFLQIALLFGIWQLKVCESKAERLLIWVCEALMLFSVILTYTRGFWLALAFSAVLFFVIFIRHWRHCLKCAGILALSLIVLLGASWVAYRSPCASVAILERFDPSLIVIMPQRPGEEPEEPEDDDAFSQAAVLRSKTLAEQNRYIMEHPILGNGLGKNLDGIRDDGKTEYMYQDMWMKTGIIGLGLFLLSCFWHTGTMVRRLIRAKKEERTELLRWHTDSGHALLWCCSVIGVAVTSYFNPFLSTPMGILVVLLTAVAVNLFLQNSPENKKKTEESK